MRFAVVETHTSPWEAHVSRALLESEGVPAFLASEHHVGASWPSSLMLGGVRLVVTAENQALARQVLHLRDSGQLQAALAAHLGIPTPSCCHCGSTEFVERKDWLAVFLSLVLLFAWQTPYPPEMVQKCRSCGAPKAEGK